MTTQPRKVYDGRRKDVRSGSGFDPLVTGEWIVTVTDNETCVVRPLTHHKRHSPDGFAWGYGGSGPAELARCILIDHFGGADRLLLAYRDLDEAVPVTLYQRFKETVVEGWPMDGSWRCTSDLIDGFLAGFAGGAYAERGQASVGS